MKFVCVKLLCIVFLLLVGGYSTNAQPPKHLTVTTVRVKPTMVNQFEALVKDEYNPALKKGGVVQSDVWQTVFGTGFEYTFIQPLTNFAALDGKSPLLKGLGEKAPVFFTKTFEMIDQMNSMVVKPRGDLSYFGSDKWEPKVAVLVTVTLHPGKSEKFEQYVKEHYLPVIKKSGIVGMATSKIEFGGNADEYVMVYLENSFADIDKGEPVARVLKPEEVGKLYSNLPEGTMKTMKLHVLAYKQDLSFAPAATPVE